MTLPEKAEVARRRLLNPLSFRYYLWRMVPLAGGAGLRIRRFDDGSCTVALPGGWRTRNPFRSTYFAAQAMAAEMSTGAPALALVAGTPSSVALIVREIRGVFVKKIVGESTFTFADVAGMRAAIEKAAAGGEAETYVARSVGRTADGTVASEFEVTWSFKKRG